MGAGVDARRDADLQLPLGADLPLAAALRARPANDLAAPCALAAGAANLQETLLVNYLAAPVTHRAGHQSIVLFGAGSTTARAHIHAWHLDLHAQTANGVLQRDFQIVAEIFAALRARAASPPSAAKQIAESEQIAQNVAEIGESRGIEALAGAESLQTLMAVTIVGSALLRIAQHTVGF